MSTFNLVIATATALSTIVFAFEPVKAQNSTAIDTTRQESTQEMVIQGTGNGAYQGATQVDVSDINAASFGGGSSRVVGGTNQGLRQTGGVLGTGNSFEQIGEQQRRQRTNVLTVGGGNSSTGSLTDQGGTQSGVIFGEGNFGSQVKKQLDFDRVGAGAGSVK